MRIKMAVIVWCLFTVSYSFAQPQISGFTPTSAAKGDTVTITGTNLYSQYNAVRFGGFGAARIISATPTEIKAVVQYGGTGVVTVYTQQGTATMPGFTFLSALNPNFSFPPGDLYAPGFVQYTNLSAAPQPITSWLWSFGDGANTTLSNPYLHFYSVAGNYEVSLIITTATDTAGIMKPVPMYPLTTRVLCAGGSDTLQLPPSGTDVFQWQTSTDSVNYTSLTDNANYSGTGTHRLILNNMPSSNYGRMYRCLVNGNNTIPRFAIRFENQWTGTVDSTWANPANWSCGSVPDAYTDVVINSGPVLVNTNATIRRLYVAWGVSFTVAAGVTLTITH